VSNHRICAAIYDRATARSESAGLAAKRQELLAPLRGNVIEIGAGTGTNLEQYRELDSLLLIEPDIAMRKRLERRIAAVNPAFEVKVVGTTLGDELTTLSNGSADSVVSTLVLCSVRRIVPALDEIRRILRDGGPFVVIEHVRAKGPARFLQTGLTPVQRAIAGGCHLNRDTRAALANAGFDVSDVEDWSLPGSLPLVRSAIVGHAR